MNMLNPVARNTPRMLSSSVIHSLSSTHHSEVLQEIWKTFHHDTPVPSFLRGDAANSSGSPYPTVQYGCPANLCDAAFDVRADLRHYFDDFEVDDPSHADIKTCAKYVIAFIRRDDLSKYIIEEHSDSLRCPVCHLEMFKTDFASDRHLEQYVSPPCLCWSPLLTCIQHEKGRKQTRSAFHETLLAELPMHSHEPVQLAHVACTRPLSTKFPPLTALPVQVAQPRPPPQNTFSAARPPPHRHLHSAALPPPFHAKRSADEAGFQSMSWLISVMTIQANILFHASEISSDRNPTKLHGVLGYPRTPCW